MYIYRGLQRFGTSGSSIFKRLSVPQLRRKASNSWSAMQDTYYSTKDIFERHKVVFTISTSIASVATAWFGYTLRHLHESRVDQRLESIEKAMKNDYQIDDPEFEKLVSGSISLPDCVATSGTTLILGYALGFRGGKWYANRKFRREQIKLLGQINPKRWPLRFFSKKRWQLRFLRRPVIRSNTPENLVTASETLPKGTSASNS